MKKKPKKNPACYLDFESCRFNDYVWITHKGWNIAICSNAFEEILGHPAPKSGKRVKVRFSVEVVK